MEPIIFTWQSKVRDYELDALGIVNHATFINYIEQARNDYARDMGIDFIEYHKKGYSLVVAGIDIQYRNSLKANDEFYVTVELKAVAHKRIIFEENILVKPLDQLAATSLVTVACVDHKTGKSCIPEWLLDKLEPLIKA